MCIFLAKERTSQKVLYIIHTNTFIVVFNKRANTFLKIILLFQLFDSEQVAARYWSYFSLVVGSNLLCLFLNTKERHAKCIYCNIRTFAFRFPSLISRASIECKKKQIANAADKTPAPKRSNHNNASTATKL